MLSLINRKEIIKNNIIKIRSLKKEYKILQKNKKPFYSTYRLTMDEKEKARYFNIAHTLIKKTKKDNLLELSNIEIFDLIISLRIETKWKKNKIEEYGYYSYSNIDKSIRTSIQINLLRKELEGIYNAN